MGLTFLTVQLASRVSFETSFDLKQPKLEPKIVSALSETESLVFRLNQNKQKSNRNSLIESLFWYFFRKFRVYPVCFCLFWFVSKQFLFVLVCFETVSVCFGLLQNSLFQLFRFHTETESFDVLIEPKQTEDQNSLIESIFCYFSEDFGFLWFVSVCFNTVLFVSIVLI